ncbi:MAG: SDR family NAD(P)-dependent oxidoreductase [Nocardioidaceae bacterium]|nr:SDR family NAD(P)-dependent oxidoreductase [Nocardioidaceae bacterium]
MAARSSAFHPGDRALVTGAASGLGLALATHLAARGCRVLATDVHDDVPGTLQHLGRVTYRRLDVTSDDDWSAALAWVREEWNGLDVLVNNAGVAAGGRIELTTTDQWRRVVDINLLGVVRGCRTFVPMLKERRAGRIVNVASAAGLVHPPRMSEYNAVKAGVVALSETLSHELSPYDVAVHVVCPTFFRTNLSSSLQGDDASAHASAVKLIDRSTVTPDQIAARVLAGVDAGRHVILTDREGTVAYAAKRFVRPLYDRAMRRASRRMAAQE